MLRRRKERRGASDVMIEETVTRECPACHRARFVMLEELFGDNRTVPVQIDCPKCGAALEVWMQINVRLVK